MTKLQKISRMENELTSELITAKHRYEDHLIQSFSSKQLFHYLKSVSVSKHSTSHLVVNSSPVTDPIKQAKLFNDYFHSTFTSSNYQLPDTANLPAPISQLNTITVKPEETYRCLVELDPTKAPGCDDIHACVLKSCTTSLTEPLTELFNLSIQSGRITHEWKIHKIRPVPKKGT